MDLGALFGRQPQPLPKEVRLLETDEAKAEIDKGEFRLLIDVRSEEEWRKGHLPGAVHAPITDINNHMEKLEEHKDEKILLYCRSQVRSSDVARMLHKKSYTRLSVMNAGFDGWDEKGYQKV